jgi:threonine/homoserine/homoserine lactone efflux protein
VLVAVIYSCVALLARKLLQARPGLARRVTLASGIIMVVLGALLLAEQIVPAVSAAMKHA